MLALSRLLLGPFAAADFCDQLRGAFPDVLLQLVVRQD